MGDMVLVQHDSPQGSLAVPDGDGGVILVEPRTPVEVPAAVAGREPGPWQQLEAGVLPDWDSGLAYRQTDDGGWESRDPGAGLLAQHDLWQLAKPAKKHTAAPAADQTPEG